MGSSSDKLSPSEFLAELTRQNRPPGAGQPAGPGQASHLADDADLAAINDFDFSDLEEDASNQKRDAGERDQHETGADSAAQVDASRNPASPGPIRPVRRPHTSGATVETPDFLEENSGLRDLFDRVNSLLGGARKEEGPFRPKVPETLEQAALTEEEIERIVLKFLLSRGSGTGRLICGQLKLPFQIVDPILKRLKQEQVLSFKGSAEMGDYDFAITDYGRERAQRYNAECTYYGAAPVGLRDYLNAMEAQSIARQEATEDDLLRAFSDLIIDERMLERLGPAINSGRGMFLFGEPGNGKTSIAERVTRCFGSSIWIPRTLSIDGDIIRLYDPGVHELIEDEQDPASLFDLSGVDQRWVNIVRPTVIAGGELTMDELEVVQNLQTKICEAPLQLKSNCGTLVIDDFGRQTMPVDVLLNRWIVPLEKRYDFLNLPSGKKIQVPFDQLIIFSTNLEPKDLVDGAFLRRIPYKIEVTDPTEEHFRALCKIMAPNMGFEYDENAMNYLIQKHYIEAGRPFRACQPRDLLLQVRNYCVYKRQPKQMSPEAFDFAVENYFSVM